jgi:hypothetical protein
VASFSGPGPSARTSNPGPIAESATAAYLRGVLSGIVVIPPEACYLGWKESLTLLAKLVEVAIPA